MSPAVQSSCVRSLTSVCKQGEVTVVVEGRPEEQAPKEGLQAQELEFVQDLAAHGLSAKSIAALGAKYLSSPGSKNAYYAAATQHIAASKAAACRTEESSS